ncbi:hypothetical protein KIPB_007813, partial [Kipferlia bialata]
VKGVTPQAITQSLTGTQGPEGYLASSPEASIALSFDDVANKIYATSIYVNGTDVIEDWQQIRTKYNGRESDIVDVSVTYDPVSEHFVVFYCNDADYSIYATTLTVVDGKMSPNGSSFELETGGIDTWVASLSTAYDTVSGSIVLLYSLGSDIDSNYQFSIIGTTASVSDDGGTVSFGVHATYVKSGLDAYPAGMSVTATESGMGVVYIDQHEIKGHGNELGHTLRTFIVTLDGYGYITEGEVSVLTDTDTVNISQCHIDTVNDLFVITGVDDQTHTGYMWVCSPDFDTRTPECVVKDFPTSLPVDYASVVYDSTTGYINLVTVGQAHAESQDPNIGTAYVATLSNEGEVTVKHQHSYASVACDVVLQTQTVAGPGYLLVLSNAKYSDDHTASVYLYGQTNMAGDKFLGVSGGLYYTGQTARVNIVGSTVDQYRSLIPGHHYYVQYDGAIAEESAIGGHLFPSAGIALTSTKLVRM